MIYADTSFLASVYMPDAHTGRAKRFLASVTDPFPFTSLHRLELRNAISLAVFQKRFTATDATAFWTDMESDLTAGRLLQSVVSWTDGFRDAENLASAQTPSLGSRSLDVLHVAVAKLMQAQEFLTFDARQSSLCAVAGLTLTVVPP